MNIFTKIIIRIISVALLITSIIIPIILWFKNNDMNDFNIMINLWWSYLIGIVQYIIIDYFIDIKYK